METINIGYFRVSKEKETAQDIEKHIKAVRDKFNPNNLIIYKERISGYNLKKRHKAVQFIKMCREVFGYCDYLDLMTKDMRITDKTINIYVWDYSRLVRNIELSLLFSIIASLKNVHIYAVKETFRRLENETPSEKFVRVMMESIQAYNSEIYSYTMSENIKVSVKTQDVRGSKAKVTTGNKDSVVKIWGPGLKKTDGTKTTKEKHIEIVEYVIRRINYFQKRKISRYGRKIIKEVLEKYNVELADSTITSWKNKYCD